MALSENGRGIGLISQSADIEQSAKLVSSFASAVEQSAQRLTKKDSDSHDPQTIEIPSAIVTYFRPNGIDSSRMILAEPSSTFANKGVSFHFSTEKSRGIKRELVMQFESLPGNPSEVVSETFLSLEEIEVLAKFAANPDLYADLARNLMVLTKREEQIVKEDREMFDIYLDQDRENIEYSHLSYQN